MNLLPDRKIKSGATRGARSTTLRTRTISDMQGALQRRMDDPKALKQEGNESITGRRGFTGTENAEEYRNMLRDGWAHGVEGVEGLDGLSTDHAERINFVRSVGGAFPIVPAFLSGAPDAMLMPTPQPADSVRGLTLVIDSSFNCSVNANEVLDYAKSIMKLVAWLQAEQIETAIYSTISMSHSGAKYLYITPIREAGDVMQPERIAAIVHPSFLRRAWFAMIEVEHYDHKLKGASMCESCYGYPQTATAEELRVAIPEAYSVILLPKVGHGDPMKAVQESETFKLRRGEA